MPGNRTSYTSLASSNQSHQKNENRNSNGRQKVISDSSREFTLGDLHTSSTPSSFSSIDKRIPNPTKNGSTAMRSITYRNSSFMNSQNHLVSKNGIPNNKRTSNKSRHSTTSSKLSPLKMSSGSDFDEIAL